MNTRASRWLLTTLLILVSVLVPEPSSAQVEEIRAASSGVLGIDWFSMSSGSGAATGGDFQLSASMGQITGNGSSGGDFTLAPGFLAVVSADEIFVDGFETGDTSRWITSEE